MRSRASWLTLALIGLLPAASGAGHLPVKLLDRQAKLINPVTGENARAPFSTERTCGACHDYDTITQGYHFRMGWNEIADDRGAGTGTPWVLSDGLMGRWYPYAYRQLAKKVNRHPTEIDLTVYDWVGFSASGPGQLPCGACHPGGGGLQFDRDGQRYDERLSADPALAEALDGDYYRSRWDESGVIEADCLICHLEGYDFDGRVAQLEQGNYRWAVVAGSGIGSVEGSVRSGETPIVSYESRLFNDDGTVTFEISWPPHDDNCMNCHGRADASKRGFSWRDPLNPDVHNKRMSCTRCHPGELDHQLAKGRAPELAAAPEHDGTMRDCAACHSQGLPDTPVPRHATVRPSHLRKLACETCHIPRLHRSAVRAVDTTTGRVEYLPIPSEADRPGGDGTWQPSHERGADGRVRVVNALQAVWWGNRDASGVVHPLFLREQQAAWQSGAKQVTDDDGDGRPEVNRDEEIVAMLRAIESTLAGSARFEAVRPVMIKGGRAHELDPRGRLTRSSLHGTPLDGTSEIVVAISHNTAPAAEALGAGGCGDCHATGSWVFDGPRIVDPYGSGGVPVARTNGSMLGAAPLALRINSTYQALIRLALAPAIAFLVLLAVVHHHRDRTKRIAFGRQPSAVRRLTALERIVHLLRLLSFLVLALTGLILAFNLGGWQMMLFGSAPRMLQVHIAAGSVFAVTAVAGIVLWFRDALFAAPDRERVRRLDRHPGYQGEVSSGRFNTRQKTFYWLTALLAVVMLATGVVLAVEETFDLNALLVTSTLHGVGGFLLFGVVLAHAYVGTVANPGAWRVLVDGRVSREWIRHHHPTWYRELKARGELPADDE